MDDVAAPKRRIKREVIEISDDEQPNDQPAGKIVKKEEEVEEPSLLTPPPQEVVELQQKVSKLEDMYKRAVKAAAESEYARQAAESLLDSKRGILESSKKESADELQKSELCRENEALKKQLEMMNEKSQQKSKRGKRGKRVEPKKIDLIEAILQARKAEEDNECQPPAMPQPSALLQQQLQPLAAGAQSINLFQPCTAGTPKSISFEAALIDLARKYDECPDLQFLHRIIASFRRTHRFPCGLCGKNPYKHEIFIHFFSEKHINKMLDSGFSIYLHAVQFWKRMLQNVIDKNAGANRAMQPAVAAAAP